VTADAAGPDETFFLPGAAPPSAATILAGRRRAGSR
jgi:hypothetical protein